MTKIKKERKKKQQIQSKKQLKLMQSKSFAKWLKIQDKIQFVAFIRTVRVRADFWHKWKHTNAFFVYANVIQQHVSCIFIYWISINIRQIFHSNHLKVNISPARENRSQSGSIMEFFVFRLNCLGITCIFHDHCSIQSTIESQCDSGNHFGEVITTH